MKCYASCAKDLSVRMLGSSGGIFPVIALDAIRSGVIVYASVFEDNLNVCFKRIDNELDLMQSFSSKYVQSNSLGIYEQVANDLSANLKVLFCGTPCQTDALLSYLKLKKINRNYLLVASIVCHGVPSSKVFQIYLEKYYKHKCVKLNMRNKELGWNYGSYSWKMMFDDGSVSNTTQGKIPFMRAFLSSVSLRPSCYNCKHKNSFLSDLIIGDFWGIQDLNLNMDEKYGVSCVLVNTEYGERAFAKVSEFLYSCEVDFKDIIRCNPSLRFSCKKPIYRNRFFRELNKDDVSLRKIEKYSNQTMYDKLIKKADDLFNCRFDLLKKAKINLNSSENISPKKIKEDCSGCLACISVCPKKAMSVSYDDEGFAYPVISLESCVNCNLCRKVCTK